MLPENLIDLMTMIMDRKAETQNVEVKSAHLGCPKRLYDTLSSFSNQNGGGVIVFGLDESQSFEAVGVYNLQDLQKKVTEQCQQMAPPVRAVFTMAHWRGKDFLAAEIPGLDYADRPCYYKGAGRIRGSFIRTGDADLPMTDYELYSFEAFRKRIRDDERTVDRASVEVLDQKRLSQYVEEKKKNHPKFSMLPEPVILDMLNITRNGKITLAALLNFGIYPQSFFPQFAITAIAVAGYEIGDADREGLRFIDNERIEGNLEDMMEGALSFCRRNMKVRTVIDPETGARNDRTEYPMAAVREAVLNSLIHRDYSIYTEGTPIQIDFFKNRLEIHSPGGLYGRLTIDELGKARPDLRNPTLAVMAEMMTESENRYSGIPTMRKAMAAMKLPEPLFENRRDEFVVTLFNGELEEKDHEFIPSGSTEDMILAYCLTPRTKKEIAGFLGMKTTWYMMKRYVEPLVNQGKLQVVPALDGGRRNLKYCSSVLREK